MSLKYGEYIEIKEYRLQLNGKTIKSIDLNENADDGLILKFTDGTLLTFGFSRNEGILKIERG